ncbi:MAG TPA: DNA polymerase IV [Candidatus Dormibacteraeota bacterium]|nr:DNA polymerase IV [Candidatus Dormibacteraeota bacterium]
MSGAGAPETPFSRCIVHLDMDAFYASVEQLREPALRGRPVVVGHSGPRGVVAAASYEARKFGVRSAMPAGEAKRLCPQAIWVAADFRAYQDYSSRVFRVMDRYTPLVEPLSLDEAFMDLSASPDFRVAPGAGGRRLKAEVFEATGGLTCSVGIATCKVVAKVASDHRKPDGLVIVPPGGEAAFLAPLPLRVLPGLGPAAERRLADLDLRLVGDVAALPDAVLEARLGSQGAGLGALARGSDPRPVTVPGAPKSISRETTFERDLTDPEELRQVVRGLAQDVTHSLRARRMWARTVRLKIRWAGFETHTLQATLAVPTDVDAEFLPTADRLLGEALAARRPVRLVGIGVANLVEAGQADLFEGDRGRARALDATLDSLRDRFGSGAVTRGRPPAREQRDFRRDDVDAARRGAGADPPPGGPVPAPEAP